MIGLYVQNNLKNYSNIHDSYIQHSPDFLRTLEDIINDQLVIEDGDILVTIDVTGLYTNIPVNEGIKACKDILEKHSDDKEKNEFVIELLELVLKHNIFELDGKLYRQLIGTAMGSKPAPDYANIFMSVIDEEILKLSDKIKFFKRFLDDCYMIFRGSCRELHEFINDINQINNSIKFTVEHTKPYNVNSEFCEDCEKSLETSIPFLDTQTKIEGGKILVDLYKKPTDRNMYLLTSSCHPAQTFKNIPYSLALRIVRICSLEEVRDQRLGELRELLLAREYKAGIVDAAIKKARDIPRVEA